jgi:hypothetical protein
MNTRNIARPADDIVSLWLKVVPEKGSETHLQTQQMLREKGKEYRTYDYTGLLFEIDCGCNQYRELGRVFYNKGKNIIHATHNYTRAGWKSISPESSLDLVRVVVCEKEPQRIPTANSEEG